MQKHLSKNPLEIGIRMTRTHFLISPFSLFLYCPCVLNSSSPFPFPPPSSPRFSVPTSSAVHGGDDARFRLKSLLLLSSSRFHDSISRFPSADRIIRLLFFLFLLLLHLSGGLSSRLFQPVSWHPVPVSADGVSAGKSCRMVDAWDRFHGEQRQIGAADHAGISRISVDANLRGL